MIGDDAERLTRTTAVPNWMVHLGVGAMIAMFAGMSGTVSAGVWWGFGAERRLSRLENEYEDTRDKAVEMEARINSHLIRNADTVDKLTAAVNDLRSDVRLLMNESNGGSGP